MACRYILWSAAVLVWSYSVAAKAGSRVHNPATRFTCQGRASGYYADVETGCQVYHMCDGLGRQFSYSCPNTTLFQQRMLVCDHWYMVNCSNSENDYDANLLIGQRDKPFVSDEDMRLRTPRPDILNVPSNNNYYDGLKEAESKFPIHLGNSIVGIADSLSSEDNELDDDEVNYRPPSSWSMKFFKTTPVINIDENVNIKYRGQNSDSRKKSNQPRPTIKNKRPHIPPPSKELSPPFSQTPQSDPLRQSPDPVYKFIKRFDPNSPDSIKTSMTRSEIINLNKHLPEGQVSSEEEKTAHRNKNYGNNFNVLDGDKKKGLEGTRFETVNIKSISEQTTTKISEPSKDLLPPKTEFNSPASTTMGPPIYYEWKWAVPAFDLEPPKINNDTNATNIKPVKPIERPYSVVVQTTPKVVDVTPPNTEYNISSYFVPDYVFPLDGPHPGYGDDDAQTSFQVQVSRPGRSSYGENPSCPQCHPAYLNPGTCEPCVVKR